MIYLWSIYTFNKFKEWVDSFLACVYRHSTLALNKYQSDDRILASEVDRIEAILVLYDKMILHQIMTASLYATYQSHSTFVLT